MSIRFILARCVWLLVAVLRLPGAVRIDVHFIPAAPTLSDLIQIDVAITGQDVSNLVLRPADIPSDCVTVQNLTRGASPDRETLTLDPLKPGACTIPPFRTRCLGSRTEDCDVQSAETVIPIGTMVPQGTAQPDIHDRNEQPVKWNVPVSREIPWVALAGMATILLLIAAIALWRKRRNNPAKLACLRLRKLTRSQLSQAETFSQLAFILRDYLDERLALGARNCSSPELIEALRGRALCQGWSAGILQDFLSCCDEAKFAGLAANPSDFGRAAGNCLTLIEVLDFDIERRSRAGV